MLNGARFPHLEVWPGESADGARHMAADEAMMRLATVPTLRWYRWAGPEVSFGYPMRWKDVSPLAAGRPAVRRWTGGGIVEHGRDLTISLAVPAEFSPPSPLAFYERVHRALAAVLGPGSRLASGNASPAGDACFTNPVRNDVLMDDRKIAGGAIRRCREGLLYQGSIQSQLAGPGLVARLCEILAVASVTSEPPPKQEELAARLFAERYGTREWLMRR